LLNTEKKVQECDATGDAIKNKSRAHKNHCTFLCGDKYSTGLYRSEVVVREDTPGQTLTLDFFS